MLIGGKVHVEFGLQVARHHGPDGETPADSDIQPNPKGPGEPIAGRPRASLSQAQAAVSIAIDVTMCATKKSLPIRSEDSTALAELGTKQVGEDVALHTHGCA